MTPVYIRGCFGILHPAAGRHGVLICSTLGDEALNVYRPLTFLAERFAASGAPALRLEYYGTGDSGGEDGEPGRYEAWLDSIAAGVRWLRENAGVGPVTLVGVRIGALLAAQAACEVEGIEALIALAPLPTGRRFLREMTLRARTNAEIWQVDSRVEDGNWFEAYGLRIDRATREALDRLDAAKLPRRPVPRALVLDQHGSSAGSVLAERLRQLGMEVDCEPADSLDAMLRDPYENAVPHSAFSRAVGWWDDSCSSEADQPPATEQNAGATAGLAETAVLHTVVGHETPVCFGPDAALFGILSTPARPRDNAPPVLLANTGANPRSGNSRCAVILARWLAAQGIASLRMDGAGIGDAAVDSGERGQPYSNQADRDLIAGIDELSRRFARPVLLLGMCSGAFHALRGAWQDQRVAGLMLVNLQKFTWHDGESLSVVQRSTVRTTRFYMHNIANPVVWQRLMHGDINIRGIARALAGRVLRRAVAAADPVIRALRGEETPVTRVRRNMRDLQRRNVQVLFVLSGHDPGLDEIAEYFGAQGRQLRRQPNVMFRLLEGADHTLSAHWARDALLGLIAVFLCQRCGVPVETGEAAEPVPARVAASRLDAAFAAPLAIDTTGSAA